MPDCPALNADEYAIIGVVLGAWLLAPYTPRWERHKAKPPTLRLAVLALRVPILLYHGAGYRNRTGDLLITSQLLYLLS